jgi:hypothetical protein
LQRKNEGDNANSRHVVLGGELIEYWQSVKTACGGQLSARDLDTGDLKDLLSGPPHIADHARGLKSRVEPTEEQLTKHTAHFGRDV